MATVTIQGVGVEVKLQTIRISSGGIVFEPITKTDLSGTIVPPSFSVTESELTDAGTAALATFVAAMETEYAARHAQVVGGEVVLSTSNGMGRISL